MDFTKKTTRRDEKYFSFGIWCCLYFIGLWVHHPMKLVSCNTTVILAIAMGAFIIHISNSSRYSRIYVFSNPIVIFKFCTACMKFTPASQLRFLHLNIIKLTVCLRHKSKIIYIQTLSRIFITTTIILHRITAQIAKFMGPTWGPPGSCRPQMGSMLAPWTFLSRSVFHGGVQGILRSNFRT